LRILKTENIRKGFQLLLKRLKLPLGVALEREGEKDGPEGEVERLDTEGGISE